MKKTAASTLLIFVVLCGCAQSANKAATSTNDAVFVTDTGRVCHYDKSAPYQVEYYAKLERERQNPTAENSKVDANPPTISRNSYVSKSSTTEATDEIHKTGESCQSHNECPPGNACLVRNITNDNASNQDTEIIPSTEYPPKYCTNMVGLSCKTDLDCPDYEKCFGGKCAMCKAQNDCRSGFLCKNGSCVPKTGKPECSKAADCGAGEVCLFGKCSSFCGFCDENQTCQNKSAISVGVCITNLPEMFSGPDSFFCMSDNDLPYDSVCYQNAPADVLCTEDDLTGEKYVLEHHLKPTPKVIHRTPSPKIDTQQNQDEDETALKPNSNSPDKTYPFSPKVFKLCRSNEQCAENMQCQNGQCVELPGDPEPQYGTEAPDSSDTSWYSQYAYVCQNGQMIPIKCRNDEDCSSTRHCMNYQCFECINDSDCASGHCSDQNTCLECISDTDCTANPNSPLRYCNPDHFCSECLSSDHCIGSDKCGVIYDKFDSTPSFNCIECLNNSECPADKPHCTSKGFCEMPECMKHSDCCDNEYCSNYHCHHQNGHMMTLYPTPAPNVSIQLTETFFIEKQKKQAKLEMNLMNQRHSANEGYVNNQSCMEDSDCAQNDGRNQKCSTLYGECMDMHDKIYNEVVMTEPGVYTETKEFCWRDSECASGVCNQYGFCGCESDASCGKGFVCAVEYGCVCQNDEACGSLSCENGKCRCHEDAQCGSGKICGRHGSCYSEMDANKLYEDGLRYMYQFHTQLPAPDRARELLQKALKLGHKKAEERLNEM